LADVFKIKWKQENDYEKSKKLSNIWRQKWWYVGTTSKIDILLRKIWKYIKEKWNRT